MIDIISATQQRALYHITLNDTLLLTVDKYQNVCYDPYNIGTVFNMDDDCQNRYLRRGFVTLFAQQQGWIQPVMEPMLFPLDVYFYDNDHVDNGYDTYYLARCSIGHTSLDILAYFNDNGKYEITLGEPMYDHPAPDNTHLNTLYLLLTTWYRNLPQVAHDDLPQYTKPTTFMRYLDYRGLLNPEFQQQYHHLFELPALPHLMQALSQ